MSGEETAVADFVGRFARNPKAGIGEEPETARVVMSRKRLVVAAEDHITIPLSTVVDVVVGNVPADLRDLFDSTVTVGYRTDDDTVETVLIEGGDDTMSKFRTVLFKCLLNGTKARLKHPARIGGRVTDRPVRTAKLSISTERVAFTTKAGTVGIDVTDVVDFERTERAPDGTSRPTLLVRHTDDGQVTMSSLAPSSPRLLNLLGRFLRIEYGRLLSAVAEIDLNEPEKQLLVAVYATDGDVDFANVLDGDAARASNVMNALREKGLIEEGPSGISLTTHGQVVVNQRIDEVNV
ncbi:CheF family chemotaxis protein [Natronomonas sp. LN261]|uniref:CheF family chemotaxis protein n=1 Tax=Natronomonas sp. LN261 TaxID=2750669 RepID=UPI0015EE47F0|nr:CheF family chemotaxis protein [Natronomonas sp. LN261]